MSNSVSQLYSYISPRSFRLNDLHSLTYTIADEPTAKLDLYENEDGYLLLMETPAVSMSEFHIEIEKNVLTISYEKTPVELSEGTKTIVSERKLGKFKRSVKLPVTVDTDMIKATSENGVLKIVLPKSPSAKPRKVKVE